MKTPSGRTPDEAARIDGRSRSEGDCARARRRSLEVVPDHDREMVLRGLEEARNGDFATEDEVRATFARYRV